MEAISGLSKTVTKQDAVVAMLRRPEGATVDEVVSALSALRRSRCRRSTDERAAGIFGALIQEVRFARDSPLEESGFELLVPP
jgi:hypothetical protein